jgi:hypothetical protein
MILVSPARRSREILDFRTDFAALLCVAPPGQAESCATVPGNLVQNCAFADGTYSSFVPFVTDPGVPDSWVPNYGFVFNYAEDSSSDQVLTNPITGADYLTMSYDEFGFPPSVDQELTDVPGVTYDGYVSGDGEGEVIMSHGLTVASPVYVDGSGSCSFVGSGLDDLMLYTEGTWDINYVVVTAVPEPRATFLIPLAMLACLVWLSTRRPVTLQ